MSLQDSEDVKPDIVHMGEFSPTMHYARRDIAAFNHILYQGQVFRLCITSRRDKMSVARFPTQRLSPVGTIHMTDEIIID